MRFIYPQNLLLFLIVMALVMSGTGFANQNIPEDEAYFSQRTVGYSLLIGGGVLTWLGVFAGFSGGDPCSENAKRNGETEDQCRERVHEDNQKFMRIKGAAIGVGLIGIGTGLYLVKTATGGNEVKVYFDGKDVGLVARATF